MLRNDPKHLRYNGRKSLACHGVLHRSTGAGRHGLGPRPVAEILFLSEHGVGLFRWYVASSDKARRDTDRVRTVVNLYQSNGACKVECMQNYAFAVVQFQRCWCSNYIPANQASVGSCNDDCPGFPDEQCGNLDQGLFGYIALSKSPSGTLGAASPSSTSKVSPTPKC